MTHGESRSNHPEYRIWVSAKQRCYDPNCKPYKHYGGRGIRMHEEWRASYSAFLADVGRRPSDKHSLDRENNNGNYEPGNCRWVTVDTQSRNRRSNRLVEYGGATHTVTDWAQKLGIKRGTVFARLGRGWTPERALFGNLGKGAMRLEGSI